LIPQSISPLKSFAKQSINYKTTNDFQELNKNSTNIFSKTVDGKNLKSTSIGMDPIKFNETSLNAAAIKPKRISFVPSPARSEKTIDPSINKSARESFAKQSINYKSTNDFQELNKNFTGIFSKTVDGGNLNSTSIGMDPIKFNEMSLNATAIKPKRISFVPSPVKSEKTIDHSISKPARKSFAGLSIYYKSTNDFEELNKNLTDIFSKPIDGDNLNSTSIGIGTADFEPAINTFQENFNIKKNIMTKAYALSGFSMYKSILKDPTIPPSIHESDEFEEADFETPLKNVDDNIIHSVVENIPQPSFSHHVSEPKFSDPNPPAPTKPNPKSVLNDLTNKLSLNPSQNSKKSITKKNKLNSHPRPNTPIRTRRKSRTTLTTESSSKSSANPFNTGISNKNDLTKSKSQIVKTKSYKIDYNPDQLSGKITLFKGSQIKSLFPDQETLQVIEIKASCSDSYVNVYDSDDNYYHFNKRTGFYISCNEKYMIENPSQKSISIYFKITKINYFNQ